MLSLTAVPAFHSQLKVESWQFPLPLLYFTIHILFLSPCQSLHPRLFPSFWGRSIVNFVSRSHHYGAGSLSFAHKSVATMASIPLQCNICPNEPDFSDVSHLLTHVASKGHLFHYFRAQVSAVQDDTIRQKLDVFDRWYDKYRIANLLSQRISSKESRNCSKSKAPTKNPKPVDTTKPTKARGRRYNVSIDRAPSPSPVKTEDRIDPELAANGRSSRRYDRLQESPSQEAALRHRAHIPRMLDWRKESPSIRMRSCSLPPYQKSPEEGLQTYDSPVDDIEDECFRTFIQSPARNIYPEPPKCSPLLPQFAGSRIDSDEEKDVPSLSPVLKGVKYPGMSLFDSASQEAQRLRNQKKDGSVLEKMVLDSAAVEPMEHIYWPGGELKKSRVITGNVESSPVEEPTPPPKRKRTRVRKPLADLSTNIPKLGRKRGRKLGKGRGFKETGLQYIADSALDTLKTVYPENVHIGYDPISSQSHAKLVAVTSSTNHRNADFPILRDPPKEHSQKRANSGPGSNIQDKNGLPRKVLTHHLSHPLAEAYYSKSPTSMTLGNLTRDRPHDQSFSLDSKSLSPSQDSAFDENKENEAPPTSLNSDAINDDTNDDETERITQRYFSVIGNQPPQFFSSMPPQMDFGGMGGPGFFGTTLNPLNPFLNRYYQQPHFSPAVFVQHNVATSSDQTTSRLKTNNEK